MKIADLEGQRLLLQELLEYERDSDTFLISRYDELSFAVAAEDLVRAKFMCRMLHDGFEIAWIGRRLKFQVIDGPAGVLTCGSLTVKNFNGVATREI